jgi:3,4-dihydroxyphenylacetate 2,3-dioxygenase
MDVYEALAAHPCGVPRGTGSIVGAALVSHVPTIVLPQEIRYELNEGREISLVPGLHRFRREVLDALEVDTIVVFDTHWYTTVEFIVAAHERRNGLYTSEELPRGMRQMPYDFPGDPSLAHALSALAEPRDDMWITPIADPHLPIHYPTVNLLGFLQGNERWLTISNCQTSDAQDFLLVGQLLAEAIAASDRRVFLLASGGMSHRFHSLRTIRSHESSDPSHIYNDRARELDTRILDLWSVGDHAAVLNMYTEYLEAKPEGKFGHYLSMIGALGGAACSARGVPFSDYENAVGTAQIHVNFEIPATGWN